MLELLTTNFSQFILLMFLLFLSAMFSGCETAIFSLKPHDLNKLRKKKTWINTRIISLYRELPELLLTILLGNMIVNILYFAVATLFVKNVEKIFGVFGGLVFGVISFCSVLIIGEITPKSLASALRVGFSKSVILPVYYFHKFSMPVRVILRKLIVFFERVVNFGYSNSDHRGEMKALLDLEFNSGNIDQLERNFLNSVIDLPEIKVGEMMTSRVDVVSVSESATFQEIIELAKNSGHSKIPVRSLQNDEYIGWVNARNIFFSPAENFILQDHIIKLPFFSEFDRCDQVMDKFINQRLRMACVVDERGATAGVLVLSDILAELFGDFGDEEALPQEMISGSADSICYIDARLSFRDFKELFEVESSMAGFTTVAGLIIYVLGRNASTGDSVTFSGIKLTVLSMNKRRINQVKAEKIISDSISGESE